jgi:hypothetical protein
MKIPDHFEVKNRRCFGLIRYRMRAWRSAVDGVEWMGRTTIQIGPLKREYPPEPLPDGHAEHMFDRYEVPEPE